ncbi:MAG TPA: nucleoside-diphosphate kinase [Gaiellales bacterium]|nr:nucleoside-diphosphate kinase [Gaiellales bacterium]
MAETERTFVMIKPDAVARGLVADVLARLLRRGLVLRGMRLLRVTPDQAARHYAEHEGKPFYPGLVAFITSGPAVAMVIEGPAAVSTVRTIMGATDPLQSAPGTIRGDLALEMSRNVVHGSDSVASAEREIAIYFAPADLV